MSRLKLGSGCFAVGYAMFPIDLFVATRHNIKTDSLK